MSNGKKGAGEAARQENEAGQLKINRMVLNLGRLDLASHDAPSFLSSRVKPCLEKLKKDRFVERFWQKDGTLWKEDPAEQEEIRNGLGWLDVVEKMQEAAPDLMEFARQTAASGFTRVVHMGMGGSSLAPLVFQYMFEPAPGFLPLTVLDTTDPATISAIERSIDLEKTLFIVASKSGTTAEPLAFDDYFFERVKTVKADKAGENFLAVTDPGTPLEKSARERSFRRVFLNFSDIGGRYSALSYFGLLPVALMGLDVEQLLDEALRMVRACGPSVPVEENPGALLGAVLGEMGRLGRDKPTFLLSRDMAVFGLWLEQLVAESTGKEGTGLLPVAGEPVGAPTAYGNDRLFVHIFLKGHGDETLEEAVRMLQIADLPLVLIEAASRAAVAQEFFRWEMATAIAGSVLGINPFDQPNVQESKDATNRLLASVGQRGSLTEPAPVMTHGPLSFFYKTGAESPEELLWNFLSQGRPGEYVALLAYLPEEASTGEILETLRRRIRDGLRLAVTLGYGPRFLHSTGQMHKGGPNTGVFIQLTCHDATDLSIPRRPYTFGIFKKAQAMGDLETLAAHGRRVMRVDLGEDVKKGLGLLRRLVEQALIVGAGGA